MEEPADLYLTHYTHVVVGRHDERCKDRGETDASKSSMHRAKARDVARLDHLQFY